MSASASSLAHRRVLVTRAENRNGPLSSLLRARGATVIHWPAYRIVPGAVGELRAAAASIERYDWIILTSGNAVHALGASGAAPSRTVRIAAIGQATAQAARELGWRVDLRPREASGEALARALIRRGMRGKRVLLPCSERAAPDLARGLRSAGAEVDAIVAYRLRPVGASARGGSRTPALDAVTFTSPSTIEGLESRLGPARLRALLARTPAVVIGRTTARALAQRGVRSARVARPTTLAGLVAAVERTVARPRPR